MQANLWEGAGGWVENLGCVEKLAGEDHLGESGFGIGIELGIFTSWNHADYELQMWSNLPSEGHWQTKLLGMPPQSARLECEPEDR